MGDNVPSHHAMSDHSYHAQPAQHALGIHKEGDHELFDVVDDDDRVLGRMRRDDVHRWQLRHRAAHVLVVNSRGEIFVQRRSRLKECAPGLWDTSVAGHVQSGESYAACAVRELAEEIGLPPATPLCQVGYLKASADTELGVRRGFSVPVRRTLDPVPGRDRGRPVDEPGNAGAVDDRPARGVHHDVSADRGPFPGMAARLAASLRNTADRPRSRLRHTPLDRRLAFVSTEPRCSPGRDPTESSTGYARR